MTITNVETALTPLDPVLRPADLDDVSGLLEVYRQAIEQGNNVMPGSVKWNITPDYLGKLIGARELFCMQSPAGLVGAVRLTEQANPLEWPDDSGNRLLIAKWATGDEVRDQKFVPRRFLPAIEREAERRGKVGTRLNCMADNPKLMRFYGGMFKFLGIVEFDSPTWGRIATAKYQRDFITVSGVQ